MEKLDKNSFLLEIFNYNRELIKFIDLKVGLIMGFIGLGVTAVIGKLKDYDLTPRECLDIKTIIFMHILVLFFISVVVCAYLALIRIIRPRYQTEFSEGYHPVFFWECTAGKNRNDFIAESKVIEDEKITDALSDYAYRTSWVLKNKFKDCAHLTKTAFLSVIFMVLIFLFAGYEIGIKKITE